jgi:hypothetical protein
LSGAKFTLYTYGQGNRQIDLTTRLQKKLLYVRVASSLVSNFTIGDPITFSGLPYQPNRDAFDSATKEFANALGNIRLISPSYLNKTWFIDDIVYNNDNTTLLTITINLDDFQRTYYFTGNLNEITIGAGVYIVVNYTDTGVLTNTSQLCPFFANSSIGGEIYATNPTGITIKNGSKLIYVLDSAVYVGNNTIGNIIDVAGSRVFKPTFIETFVPPTYLIQPSTVSVNESGTVVYTITTSNFGTGTLYWTNSGTTIGADFTDGTNYGTVSMVNDFGTISKTLVNDFTAEGPETIILELRTNSTSGPIVATAPTVSVIDTSTQTYAIAANFSFRDEGQTITFTVTTQGVSNGTTLYYKNIGTTNAADFDDGLNFGSFNINNNSGTVVKTIRNDFTSENQENIQMEIHTVSVDGPTVVTSGQVQVFDTSIPTYSVAADVNPVAEGNKVIFTITTQGVPDGTTLFWTNSGTTVAADFYENTNSGNFTVSNNRGTVSRTLYYDLLTEGSQTIVFQVRTESTSGPIVAFSVPVTVTDTSISTSPYYGITPTTYSTNEGNSVSFDVYAEQTSNGTTLYWTNEGTSTADDFTDGLNFGTVTINSSHGTVVRNIKIDGVTEGAETFIFALRTGSVTGPIVIMTTPITIAANAT